MLIRRNIYACLLLFVSTMFVIPQELVHSFADHHDTPADVCKDHPEDAHVEEQHHTCELLKFKLTPEFTFEAISNGTVASDYSSTNSQYEEQGGCFIQLFTSLRAPPVC